MDTLKKVISGELPNPADAAVKHSHAHTHTHTPKDTHTHTRTLTTLTANGAWLGKGGGRGRGGRDEGLKEEVAMIYAVVVSSIIDAMVATSRCFESANSPRIDGTIY